MTKLRLVSALLFTAAFSMASCSEASNRKTETGQSYETEPFSIETKGQFAEPWALALEPGSGRLFITERGGNIQFFDPSNNRLGSVEQGVPEVDYGGQGGLGDFAFAPDYEQTGLIYLSWAEAGDRDTRGAVVGRGKLVCEQPDSCAIDKLTVIWRQTPKVTGRGHYSHRIAFSPDGRYLFISSGERQKQEPAQDISNNLGTIVRLLPDGSPAPDNPFADKGGVSAQIWSYGHRNVLGLQFDSAGQLWDLEHGPAGGDELNLVQKGKNYGWPLVSGGDHYDGKPIPDPSTRPDLQKAAISWTPVIAPGDFIFYSGKLWRDWEGEALIANLKTKSISRISVQDPDNAKELARYSFDNRLRDIIETKDGSLWVIEDGEDGRLLHLTPAK
ncbi:PQQ-dependent sugar dehydrogenase [Altericroceibacterium spongiae]|uniref:PQQ-dependent sugar dehydrogenase n=1 Tax=Altericroceibacterium spongiae TaxID=2320269 RepID=A0A420EMV8_9SPHN|nr:PQQ-dependent sugar dehydrogenase [Altericroceibacterium spongiae]RKF21936.1 PQQ-dependent sugar dehydrogenase [Altericroceibacterium spongiae]